MEDEFCASCDRHYFIGCKVDHHHWGLCVADGMQDIRALWCGCYAHKTCQRSGNHCRQHGAQDDILGGADQLYPEPSGA